MRISGYYQPFFFPKIKILKKPIFLSSFFQSIDLKFFHVDFYSK